MKLEVINSDNFALYATKAELATILESLEGHVEEWEGPGPITGPMLEEKALIRVLVPALKANQP